MIKHALSLYLDNNMTSNLVLYADVGEELALSGGSGFTVRPFVTTHSIPSQGYLVYSKRKKLRADLQGMPPEEIRAMRLGGKDVTETTEVPEIAYTGDTTIEFLNASHSLPSSSQGHEIHLRTGKSSLVKPSLHSNDKPKHSAAGSLYHQKSPNNNEAAGVKKMSPLALESSDSLPVLSLIHI